MPISRQDRFTAAAIVAAGLLTLGASLSAKAATLFPGKCLHPGESIQSDNKLHTLTVQADGNVILYNRNSHPLWKTNTAGSFTPRDLRMQADGNLVLYSTDGKARWASHTSQHPGAFLNIQDDGNLVIYRKGSVTETADNSLWAAASNDIWQNPTQNPGSTASPNLGSVGDRAQEILAVHNKARAEVGVPPLQWSESLAASAKQWADYLASASQFYHDPNNPEGENLAMTASYGSVPAPEPSTLVNEWIDGSGEKGNYNGQPFGNGASVTGDYRGIGHYTQLVWRNTTQVGCGFANGIINKDGANWDAYYLVCRYDPPGNVVGQLPY